ncbi:MAG: hypothetical protein ACRD5F_11990 [Candidatus Acidiferrales bacterium]
MSRIYDALKQLHRDRTASPRRPAAPGAMAERRRSSRRPARVAVFVYGHSAQGVPFFEETHMTNVNAEGGLTSLAATVTLGQELLLVNLGTQAERACRVVRIDAPAGSKSLIALAFSDSHADFWEASELAVYLEDARQPK